jgi:menaquinone-dependent protoporphyrinogen oxidase
MTVLVAFASKHGATEEIAQTIGEVLQAQGVDVEVKRMEDVDTVMPYSAFVLGSAIYVGSWLRTAREFVDEHAETISRRPTWLFSSGPIGSPPHPAASESFDGTGLAQTTQAREHRVFGGRLDKKQLALTERALAGALRVPGGDYREWDAVAAWATAIARVVSAEQAAHV